MNELEPSKIPMILGTQYFFAVLREDKDTFEAVLQQTAELSKEEVFEFIKYFSANLIYMYEALCESNPKIKDVMESVYQKYRKEGEPIA